MPPQTEPSAEIPPDSLRLEPPARSPSGVMTPAFQRKAIKDEPPMLSWSELPVTAEPLAEMSRAKLPKREPGRAPRPWKDGGPDARAAAVTQSVTVAMGARKR